MFVREASQYKKNECVFIKVDEGGGMKLDDMKVLKTLSMDRLSFESRVCGC